MNVISYRGVLSARHHLRPHVTERDAEAFTEPSQIALFERKGDVEVVAKLCRQVDQETVTVGRGIHDQVRR